MCYLRSIRRKELPEIESQMSQNELNNNIMIFYELSHYKNHLLMKGIRVLMMWKRNRNEAPVEVEQETQEIEQEETQEVHETQEIPEENTDIPVITWNPTEGEPTLLVASPREAKALYSAIIETANEKSEEMEWVGIDLQKTMFEDNAEAHQKPLALNLQEVWDLSVALETEITERQEGKEGKRILVLIEGGDVLAGILMYEENRDDPKFKTVQPNLNKIITEGAAVNINVLMRVEEDTVDAWKAEGFTQTLVL